MQANEWMQYEYFPFEEKNRLVAFIGKGSVRSTVISDKFSFANEPASQ
jgi:hypothetical protein